MKLTVSERSALGLSTGAAPGAYTARMPTALKAYLDAERGRAARLADELGISRSYVSDLASGKKEPSIQLLRRLADATGLEIAQLTGHPQGMSEGEATPYAPGPRANRLRDMAGMLFPGLRHPSYYIAGVELPAFGILNGDLLVTEANFDPERIEPGKLVVASLLIDGAGRTVIGRLAHPWIIDGSGRIAGEIAVNAAVLGLIQVVVRSSDPAAF